MNEYDNNQYYWFLFILYFYLLLNRRRTNRCIWVRNIFHETQRREAGAQRLINEMCFMERNKYLNYLRVTPEQFDFLLGLIGPHITKSVTILRSPILPATRLALTLRYLASGDSMVSLSYQFRIGKSTVSKIILETTTAIWNVLQPIVLKQPTEHDWKRIAKEFNDKWNFVNCIGAIDGKHYYSGLLNIKKQNNSLNLQTDTEGLHKSYIPIINKV
ncbi:hypothetical protein ALC57_04376 [Trachymyrmex cornetzi]|uniref:Nuclease HARBI1 n=1 Tax=Trachymyrmex cornetzi TaxID=471704 RepID=A0A151JCE9_9HYME|nr:hypothetical protein ALC57_04376 [Trachymyrmex cornetzi]